jgi:hypothetical protein
VAERLIGVKRILEERGEERRGERSVSERRSERGRSDGAKR